MMQNSSDTVNMYSQFTSAYAMLYGLYGFSTTARQIFLHIYSAIT